MSSSSASRFLLLLSFLLFLLSSSSFFLPRPPLLPLKSFIRTLSPRCDEFASAACPNPPFCCAGGEGGTDEDAGFESVRGLVAGWVGSVKGYETKARRACEGMERGGKERGRRGKIESPCRHDYPPTHPSRRSIQPFTYYPIHAASTDITLLYCVSAHFSLLPFFRLRPAVSSPSSSFPPPSLLCSALATSLELLF
ncbi:hypothetical protein C8R45DRAFT_560730 [Mycena sanguinolenta]|nr:hypothetical protein C8R45DRAFT_560730 [Mycena sanguinolenta]